MLKWREGEGREERGGGGAERHRQTEIERERDGGWWGMDWDLATDSLNGPQHLTEKRWVFS